MGALDLTIQVLNISPKASREDLLTFFSYCGTVEEIQIQRDKYQSQLALVTFRQPYALQTALLLNNATIVDRRVHILPLGNLRNIPIEICTSDSMNSKRDEGGSSPATHVVRELASKSEEAISSARERVSGAGRILTQQAHSAISAAEQTAGNIKSAIMTGDCVPKCALWLSDILGKASKGLAELGNVKDRDMSSGKQK